MPRTHPRSISINPGFHSPAAPANTETQPFLSAQGKLGSRCRENNWLWLAVLAFLCLFAFPLHAQTFPKLTGRVVDTAGLLQPEQAAALEAKLAGIETTTGHQFVVATVPDLQGYPIEDYGYRLGRAWGIGKQGTNDGVILLVAKNDRKLRIEVGYGLEPLLTDAYSSIVINTVITPRFKTGDFAGGIDAGVDAIAQQIGLTPEEAAKRTAELSAQQQTSHKSVNGGAFIFWIVIFFFVILPMIGRLSGGRRYRGGGGIGNIILWSALNGLANSGRGGGSGWGGGGFGGGDGGGFSGGGGSFGGGGASGGW